MNNIEFLKENGIDVDHGLELLGDIEMYNETVEDFLTEQDTRIPKLKEYKEAKDTENYAILAHSMKSDSKYLGFMKLIDLAYQHELKGKENDIDFINEHFDELIEEANRIDTICKQYLGR
jgi:HPt (histidine-containing phosphotransfer) domain-containing protein